MKKRREAEVYTSPGATVSHTMNRFRTTAYNEGWCEIERRGGRDDENGKKVQSLDCRDEKQSQWKLMQSTCCFQPIHQVPSGSICMLNCEAIVCTAIMFDTTSITYRLYVIQDVWITWDSCWTVADEQKAPPCTSTVKLLAFKMAANKVVPNGTGTSRKHLLSFCLCVCSPPYWPL